MLTGEVTDVSEECRAFIFRDKQPKLLTRKIKALRSFEASEIIYQSTRRNTSGDWNLQNRYITKLKRANYA